MMVSSLGFSEELGFDCDDYNGWMGVLEDGAALHDWYTPGNDVCLPSFAGVVEFSLFVQWDGSDAWVGADEIHRRLSLCVYL
jgi:hypothetical protein